MNKFKLEERKCKHPKCNLTFRVAKESKQEFHSENCRANSSPAKRNEFLEEIGFLPQGKREKK